MSTLQDTRVCEYMDVMCYTHVAAAWFSPRRPSAHKVPPAESKFMQSDLLKTHHEKLNVPKHTLTCPGSVQRQQNPHHHFKI